MDLIICKDKQEASKKAAEIMISEINNKKDMVLGLATGSTPIGLYKELIAAYEAGKVSFKDIKSFNLDEYYKLEQTNDQSYKYFMKDNLFDHVDIDQNNTDIPDSMVDDVEKEVKHYDEKIEKAGGIDLQILGIGQNGHIGFNEPSDHFSKGTSLVDLTESTIKANSRFFENESDVPKQALSMGIGNIMKARKVILLAFGKEKAEAVKNSVEGNVTPQVPASILQFHNDVIFIVDEDAASKLSR